MFPRLLLRIIVPPQYSPPWCRNNSWWVLTVGGCLSGWFGCEWASCSGADLTKDCSVGIGNVN